jgi:hypothetical protein
VVSREQARELALGLPEAVEQDHHGRPSFRVANKIFATQWDEGHMNVMLDEGGIRTAIHSDPRRLSKRSGGARGSPRCASISVASTPRRFGISSRRRGN